MIFDDTHCLFCLAGFLFILYAEVHYRIALLPNRLFRKEPEILFDAPFRIDPGQPIPLLLFIKDANHHPIELKAVEIRIQQQNQQIYSLKRNISKKIDASFWFTIFYCPVPNSIFGVVELDAQLTFINDGHIRKIRTDNYKGTSHGPLTIVIDKNPLPGHDLYLFGELHYHSHFTNDQVEFGAPLDVARIMAQAQGLSFLAVTDHSYDLDDQIDNYLINDHHLPKWRALKQTSQEMNKKNRDFIILPGEELSAGNAKKRNVHLLILNNARFFSGHGDSAEKWLQTAPQWLVGNVLDHLEENALAFAAHPTIRPSFLQRLLFNRDRWSTVDYAHPRLDGMQIWNGPHDLHLKSGLRAWIDQLLLGRKPVLIAGSDAHGNFNKSRHIKIPFWQIAENDQHVFGQVRTGIPRQNKPLMMETLSILLKSGHCLITSGPVIHMRLRDREAGHTFYMGDTCTTMAIDLMIDAKSSETFGMIHRISLFFGDRDTRQEILMAIDKSSLDRYRCEIILTDISLPRHGYIRAEMISKKNGRLFHCYTNPIFLTRN